MSVKTTAKVWEWSKSEGVARLVMLALADFCDDFDRCFPGVTRIAFKCRTSERSVQRAFKELAELGELMIEEKMGMRTNGGATNRFNLILKGGDNLTGGVVTNEAKGGDTGVTRSVSRTISKEDSRCRVPTDSRHSEIIEGWTEDYPEFHNGDEYVVIGGRDGKALKTLLASISLSSEEVLSVARRAWKNKKGFWCSKMTNLTLFCTKFNDVQDELSKAVSKPVLYQ